MFALERKKKTKKSCQSRIEYTLVENNQSINYIYVSRSATAERNHQHKRRPQNE